MEDLSTELDSFILKFQQLWRNGFDAHLDLETHAGNAWVGLKMNLGQHPSSLVNEVLVKRSSPSRNRRRKRRACTFKQQNVSRNLFKVSTSVLEPHEDSKEDKVVARNVIKVIPTEEVDDISDGGVLEHIDNDVVEVTENQNELDKNMISAEEAGMENELDEIAITAEEADLDQDDVTGKVQDSKDSNDDAPATETSQDIGELCVNMDTSCNEPQLVTLHSTAVIDNSPFSSFSQDEWESIGRFATNKEHLRKNILNIRYCQSSTRYTGSDLFQHIVEIEIVVSTKSLWQSPRAYLWKHVGQDYWERGNGSRIRLTKIHQK